MAVEALCPICGAVFNLKDDMKGKKVRCTKCEHPFTVGGEARAKDREEKDSIQPRASAPKKKSARGDDDEDDRLRRKSPSRRDDDEDEDDDRPRGKKSKRVYHDDEDDDVERKSRKLKDQVQRKGSGKKDSGLPVTTFVIAGAALVGLLVLCGGGGVIIYALTNGTPDAANQAQNNFNNIPIGPGPAGDPFRPMVGKTINTIDDALKDLKSAQPGERQNAADWLARQKLDQGRQKEVARALEPLLAEADEKPRHASYHALKVWADKDSAGPLAAAFAKEKLFVGFNDAQADACMTLGRLKDERGAEPVARFLPDNFARGPAVNALQDMGPVAEKAVLKYYHHKDGGARDAARRLVSRYGTKPAPILDATLTELRATDREQRRIALDWLASPECNDARQKADKAQLARVSQALDVVLTDVDGGIVDAAMRALGNGWASADNVPMLAKCVQEERFPKRHEAMALLGKLKDVRGAAAVASRLPHFGDRGRAGDALIAMGPVARPEVEKYLDHSDRGVVNETKRVLATYGNAGNLDLAEAIGGLRSTDKRRQHDAAKKLQTMAVDETKRAEVAKLLEAMVEDGADKSAQEQAVKALGVWGTKESVPVLIKVVEGNDPLPLKHAAMESLAKLKDDRAVKPIAARLLDLRDRAAASKALQAMGPDHGKAIEAEVTAGLFLQDKAVKIESAKILGAVGTKDCILNLEKAEKAALIAKPMQRDVAKACADAIVAIKGR
jgi:predicted Zn finger-like uncharacterized protein